jgi:hypothetical protein
MKKEAAQTRRECIRDISNDLDKKANILLNDIISDLTEEQRKKVKGLVINDIIVLGINSDNSIDVELIDDEAQSVIDEPTEPVQTSVDAKTWSYDEVMYLIDYLWRFIL